MHFLTPRRSVFWFAGLLVVLLALIATSPVQAQKIAVAEGVSMSPEQLGRLATELYNNPEQADALLQERGITLEQRREAIWKVTGNPDWSRRYRRQLDVGDYLVQRRTFFEFGTSFSDLDNNFDDWNSQYLSFGRRIGNRSGFYGSVSRTEWFDETDEDLMAGMYFPITNRLRGNVRMTTSPSNEVLPRWSGRGTLSYWLPMNFEIEAGWQVSDYNRRDSRYGMGTLRKYWDRFWVGYTYTSSWVGSSGPEDYHQGTVGYINGLTNIGFSVSDGDAITEVSSDATASPVVRIRDVTNVSLWGQYPLNNRFRLTFLLSREDVEDLYDRDTAQVGVQYRFW